MSLLVASDMEVVLSVLGVLYVFRYVVHQNTQTNEFFSGSKLCELANEVLGFAEDWHSQQFFIFAISDK